jgi:hypothetical protein
MSPSYPTPIVPILPDVGPALVVPFLIAAVGGCVGLAAVVVLVIRSGPARRRRVRAILDGCSRSVLDPGDRRRHVDPAIARSSSG